MRPPVGSSTKRRAEGSNLQAVERQMAAPVACDSQFLKVTNGDRWWPQYNCGCDQLRTHRLGSQKGINKDSPKTEKGPCTFTTLATSASAP